ncbi:hypothetical protein TNCV_3179671 [Trichonephila clavipes]|nr:hypothetical protein TNCV_3179671 [Trichonephila clavipes]
MEVTCVEQRGYIKIAVLRGRNAKGFHIGLVKVLENNAKPYRSLRNYQQGRVFTSDEQRSKRLVRMGTYLAPAVIEQLMDEDRLWMRLEL